MTRTLRHWLAGVSLTALAAGVTSAQPQRPYQDPPAQPQSIRRPAPDAGGEVLARGPVHEAFAETTEFPTGGAPVVEKAPPDAIEELPPDQKPDGDNVQWIPGYWSYDDEGKDYIWISGFWRLIPPGRIWVPGSWREVRGGFQYVSGFWNAVDTGRQQQTEIEYLPQPPAPLGAEPSTPAPTATSFAAPGSWTWRTDRYAWRPACWLEHRPDWVWVPDHYCWSPAGYIHVPGYWDYPPDARGILFAPVRFRPDAIAQPDFVFTPTCAVFEQSLLGALFVRRGYGGYYFGDYFEPNYATGGYRPWVGIPTRGPGFATDFNAGRTASYDPLLSYYSIRNRDDPRWSRRLRDDYGGRTLGDLPRPPRTLVVQNTVADHNANLTHGKNVTVATEASALLMLASLADVRATNKNITLKAVGADDRVQEQKRARELTRVSVSRREAETGLASRNATAIKPTEALRTARFEASQSSRVRSEAPRGPAATGAVDRPSKGRAGTSGVAAVFRRCSAAPGADAAGCPPAKAAQEFGCGSAEAGTAGPCGSASGGGEGEQPSGHWAAAGGRGEAAGC